jgi:hydroxyacylglutathione hydrolase
LTNAEICHSKETPFKYGQYALSDGEIFRIGRLKIEAIYTPGHTIDSMCYVVYNSGSGSTPLLIFSGDTLFIGDVGRTDLPGLDIWEEMSGRLFDSLHEKILSLGDKVLLYPSHTAGSICGRLISDREMSTIGYERITNSQLDLNREDFDENRLKNKMLKPPYFTRMEDWNLNGPPLLRDQPLFEALNVNRFEKEWKKSDSVVLDTRDPGAFAGSHIPGSINIWLDGVSFFPGWVLDYDQRILLLTERNDDLETAISFLHRIGFDNIAGYLCSHFKVWRNQGKPVEIFGTISAKETKRMLESRDIFLLDVREEYEWEAGHIEGAERIYVGHLQKNVDKLPEDKPIVTTCVLGRKSRSGF